MSKDHNTLLLFYLVTVTRIRGRIFFLFSFFCGLFCKLKKSFCMIMRKRGLIRKKSRNGDTLGPVELIV